MAQIEKKKERLVDPAVISFAVLTLITGAICYGRGEDVFFKGIDASIDTMAQVFPKMAGAMLMSGFVQVLVPREMVMKLLGEKSGLKGIFIASIAGALTPGGPMISFPLISALYCMGASISSLVAYLLSWELMGIQRIMIWELPLMGVRFTVLRVAISLLFPLLAGLLAEKVANYLDGNLEKGK